MGPHVLSRTMNAEIQSSFSEKESSLTENTQGAARSEIQEYLQSSRQRRRMFPRAALVGLGAGFTALLFRAALAGAAAARNAFIVWAQGIPAWGWIFPILLTLTGTIAAVVITRRYAPEAAGSGIPHLEAVLRRFRELNWKRVLPVKFFGGIIAIGSGLALGREGPTVQMGGAVGDAFSRWLKVSERDRLTLMSAGAGAGLSAAFNAPLAGVIFVLEELRGDFQPIVFGSALVAAIAANVVVRMAAGQFPIFTVPDYPAPPMTSLPLFAVLGILAGLFGVMFNLSLLAVVRGYDRLPGRFALVLIATTGCTVGLAGWFSPILLGSGDTLVEAALQGCLSPAVVPVFLIARFLLTMASYGTGAPGGIFAPMLVLGALLGLGLGHLAHGWLPQVVPLAGVFAVVGMAACFTSIVRAPLTGIVLIVEMTGSYSLMLPLLVSCFCAYVVAEGLKELPIYEALLERDLQRGGPAPALNKAAVVDLIVESGAPFAGCAIRSLGLPAGCIIVRITDGKRERVPTADTRLEAHTRITVLVAPEAADALEKLRRGCAASGNPFENAD